MKNQKIEKLLQFYLLATELKDKIRSGWKVWNIERERVESISDYIKNNDLLKLK